ncbi:MAG: 4-(cytidine 5'-diphospho)-2-C-methyl-D-erythritol kinase [Acidimicrobiales bacterium]
MTAPPAPPADPGSHSVSQQVLAPAKLTLSLRVTGVRPDGYHLIDAEMVTVDLVDRLSFSAGDGPEVLGDAAAGVSEGIDNLVRRALSAAGVRAQVVLEKRIPAGAGLGGGSADAAAVLRWAGCGDVAVAAALGSDVPFCLVGGSARVRGTGEIVDPLPWSEVEGRRFTLLIPPFAVSTPAVYQAWDHLGGPSGEGPNDLTPAALAVEPEMARWRDLLGDATGEMPVLAGSGSAWFVSGDHPGEGRLVVKAVRP